MANSLPFAAGSLALASWALVTAPVAARVDIAAPAPATAQRSPATLVAQADRCRQVSAGITGLNIRQSPAMTAAVIGVVPRGGTVNIDDLGSDGWVPIAEPMDGYVSSRYLTRCDGVADPIAAAPSIPSGGQCRQVTVRSGLNVRVEPNRYAARLTALPTGTEVTLADSETDTWTMISAPVEGYVAKRFLGSCAE